MFVVADDEEFGNILEAGIDVFRISEGTTISTKDLEIVDHFKLFPNPADNQVTVESISFHGKATIRVFDIQGKQVFRDVLNSRSKTLSLDHLPSGTYFLNVRGEDFRQTIKLIKL